MPHCAIINCKNSTKVVSVSKGGISFHRFPHDPHMKGKWIEATGNKDWFPTKYSAICSIHFNDDDFKDINKKRRLTEEAYPTVNILKTVTSEEDVVYEQPSSSKEALFVAQDTDEHDVSKESTLLMSWEIKLQRKLKLAQRKIERQKVIIKRLREQNRRKNKRICALKGMAEGVNNEPLEMEKIDERQAGSSDENS